jgi:hypothetical protein
MQPEYAADGAKLGWLNQPGLPSGALALSGTEAVNSGD